VVTDASPHQMKFVALGADIKLDVLDWGGTGRPVVLLAGIGNTAHVFDKFAPKLAASFHVYGITRRGIGASGESEIGYTSDELGDDIVAVLDSLHLDPPVLIGHSFAGEELSSVGTRYPERVAGLVYLDAAYAYALYNEPRGDYFDEPRYFVDMAALQQKLNLLFPTNDVARNAENKHLLDELLKTTLPEFERDLKDRRKELKRESRLLAAPAHALPPILPTQPGMDKRRLALFAGMQKYKNIQVPVLAIYAIPLGFQSAKSVLLILLRSPNGQVVAQGTEFLIEGGKIVTNEHVIKGETAVVDLGGVRVPMTVELVDDINDLATSTNFSKELMTTCRTPRRPAGPSAWFPSSAWQSPGTSWTSPAIRLNRPTTRSSISEPFWHTPPVPWRNSIARSTERRHCRPLRPLFGRHRRNTAGESEESPRSQRINTICDLKTPDLSCSGRIGFWPSARTAQTAFFRQ
jgi:pimeloyl-ACP methyl ester carboxylesterase